MNYIKLNTSDGETRWLNLTQMRRATLATEGTDQPMLVIVFEDGDSGADLKIRASDAINRQAIEKITQRLDHLCGIS